MNHDNIGTTIEELLEKVEVIDAEMHKNRGGRHYRHLDRNEQGSESACYESNGAEQRIETKTN